jgi:hypothetical protein
VCRAGEIVTVTTLTGDRRPASIVTSRTGDGSCGGGHPHGTLHHDDPDEFGLSVVLRLEPSGVDQRTADELGAAVHQLCPYAQATRGDMPVTVEATVV